MIHSTRIHIKNEKSLPNGSYILYWMQQSQRSRYNHALEHAVREANRLNLPLVVFFGLTPDFPGANTRHYTFMLQGLKETAQDLLKRGITVVIKTISPESGALELSHNASMMVTDRGYLNIQRSWREYLEKNAPCKVVEVESDVIIPVETAYHKEAWSAAVLRRRINTILFGYLVPLEEEPIHNKATPPGIRPSSVDDIIKMTQDLTVDTAIPPEELFHGGYSHARKQLDYFVSTMLHHYHDKRSDPSLGHVSRLSPWLHFGQISPLEIALEASRHPSPGTDAFLEELIVRRELAMNFCWYNRQYDLYESLPDWARASLAKHKKDKREYTYTMEELEQGKTHDPYWNAAQTEMVSTGFMHGYMRMYWGKKILEWSPSPEEAFKRALYLNNTYQLDGRDPNSFAGVAWCFGKHDRPWQERDIFGSVRYMNAAGLKRKFNIDKYVEMINNPGSTLF